MLDESRDLLCGRGSFGGLDTQLPLWVSIMLLE